MLSEAVLATGLSSKELKAMLTTHAALAVPAASVRRAARTIKAFWHDQKQKLPNCLEIYPLMCRPHAVIERFNTNCLQGTLES